MRHFGDFRFLVIDWYGFTEELVEIWEKSIGRFPRYQRKTINFCEIITDYCITHFFSLIFLNFKKPLNVLFVILALTRPVLNQLSWNLLCRSIIVGKWWKLTENCWKMVEIVRKWLKMMEIVGKWWKLMENGGNCWKMVDIVGNNRNCWEMIENGGNSWKKWKLMEIVGKWWKMLENHGK